MPSESKFRVALIQMACSTDPDENVSKALWRIREAAGRGAAVVCLPELFRSQYFCREEDARLFDLAEPVPGPSTEALGAVARECRITVIGSLFERRAPGLYHNTAVVLKPDGTLGGVYRKMHIPDDPLYFEKFYFTPGDLGYRAFETPHGRIAPLVCWDQWYPEAARVAALGGALLLVYPTAIGWHPSEKEQLGAAQHDALAHHPARTCDRQRRLRGRGEPGRLRRPSGPRARVLGRGRSPPARSVKCWRRRPTARRKPCCSNVIRAGSRKCGGTGLSCATAGSIPTLRCSNAS